MNMVLHGITNPNICYSDTLSRSFKERNLYDIILANPPFKGSVDKSDIAEDLTVTGKSKKPKTELLFLNLFVNMIVPGGKCGDCVALLDPAGTLEDGRHCQGGSSARWGMQGDGPPHSWEQGSLLFGVRG